MSPDERFDYVVVGAGSAGCVVASRLAEDGKTRVCLIEAGPPDKSALIDMPLGFAFLPKGTKLNWAYDTAPQTGLDGRIRHQPRGRTLGGSSAINAMIYIRGAPSDYDRWESLGATGWSWREVLPWFKKSEDNARGPDEWHGAGGPLSVCDLRSKNPLSDIFLAAARELQLPMNDDFNGPVQEGMGYYQVTQREGRRCSAAAAWLETLRGAPNARILTDAHCERILIENGRATGVVVRRGGEVRVVRAEAEVILSAGAFGSPKLLMLSGVGPGAHLREHGVAIAHDAPDVGANLQDHVDYTVLRKARTKHSIGLNVEFIGGLWAAWRAWKKSGAGALTSNLAEAGGFVKSDPAQDEPDLQLHFLPALVDDHGRRKHFGHGFSGHACVLRPKSRGTVRLASHDPARPPVIDPNFLTDTDDLERLVKGARLLFRLFEAPAFAGVAGRYLYCGPDADDDALIADIKARADTIYHPVGTCRMGRDARAVVDPKLRLRGVEGLRVADASVMPTLIGGNTNAPSIMIGERCADFIRRG